MVKKILEWKDDKFEALNGHDPQDLAKAFGLGVLDGVIDVLVVIGAVSSVAGIAKAIKSFKK